MYAPAQIDELVTLYLGGADRDKLDPILDACVAVYNESSTRTGRSISRGRPKAFLRTYGFLASILPYTNADWEKLSIFLNFLVPKLPAPKEEDLSKGILEAIDMDSYRVEKKAAIKIQLAGPRCRNRAGANLRRRRKAGARARSAVEYSQDIQRSVRKYSLDGQRSGSQADYRRHPARVAADTAYQNAKKNSDKQNARIEHDKALAGVMSAVLKDDTELFKQFSDNPAFRRWLGDTVFSITYESPVLRP